MISILNVSFTVSVGQRWREEIAKRNGAFFTTRRPATVRSYKILGEVWVPPSAVVVYENGNEVDRFKTNEPSSKPIEIHDDVTHLAIKV